ncbi:MAG: hypothetical protein IJY78_02335 [Bacteroidaceae bacterium]|nr:hypothetical protein [Bacteroidaceae bacterium]
MKKFLLSFLFISYTFFINAQLNGDGYYRVKNAVTERYIIVRDNKGKIDVATTSADLGAVELWKNFSNVVSDPGSILYIQKTSNGAYRLKSQGTDTYEIIGHDLLLKQNKDGKTYKAYQSMNGNVVYLSDSEHDTYYEDGKLNTNDKGTNYRNWYIMPVSSNNDEYFGITPEFEMQDGYFYSTFYASFPFDFVSSGMNAYYVTKVDRGMVVVDEIKNGKISSNTPVIIRSSCNSPADNKIEIYNNSASAPKQNLLKGVFFNNKYRRNRTAYNPKTMRVLGKMTDGKLGFITADFDYLPANKAYLVVSEDSPSEMPIVTLEEYLSDISDIRYDKTNKCIIYNVLGVKIADDISALNQLPKGIYIVNGKKYYKP